MSIHSEGLVRYDFYDYEESVRNFAEMKRQPRAKAMLPAIKELIVIRSVANKEKDRNLLAHELREEIKRKFPQELPPTKTTLVKKISEARNHSKNPLDTHWHLGLLNKLSDYGISHFSADDIAAILNVQHWLYDEAQDAIERIFKKRDDSKKAYLSLNTISIRQAKWIAALHRKIGDDSDYLWMASVYYTYREILSEIIGTPFDTWQIDLLLLKGNKKEFIKRQSYLIDADKKRLGEDFESAFRILASAQQSKECIPTEDEIKQAIKEYEEKEL